MLDWDDLRIFLAVARTRKIAPAARTLGVDATTIGRRLTRLSSALEADLFEGGGNDRRLTPHGQALMRHAESAESAALAAMEEVTGEQHALSGQVRLSVAEGFGTWVLAPRIADFHARHPHIGLDIITASGFLNPSRREADMAVMLARPQRGRLMVRKLGDYTLRLYASHSYLEENGTPSCVDDLRGHSLTGYVPEFIFAPELDYIDEVESGLEAQLRSTSINVQHSMIRHGAGIGILPDFLAVQDSQLRPLLHEGEKPIAITRSFWLVIHADMRRLARIDAVAKWLEECTLQLNRATG
ncbi:MAG: LysR family transcriptional regulator [Sphingobium sp.]|nr:LysR family transcriptional regulator [Sphingobium sp.]MCP5398075.1 LysR family transcriptional regulator [Sphingomonas sp.]